MWPHNKFYEVILKLTVLRSHLEKNELNHYMIFFDL